MYTHNSHPSFAVVVNDNLNQLNLLCGLLRQAGLEPRAFSAADAALTAFSAHSEMADLESQATPALIVTDLYMPGIDGWRFCRLLRSPEYASFNQVPILVVSSTFTGEDASRIAADLGAEALLPSPVDGERFCEQVRTILSGQRVRTARRALIADDNAALCQLLKVAFDKQGYETDTALTFHEAADAFANKIYDVVVLDYHLPDGSGEVLLDEFHAQRPECVCVMVTVDPSPELARTWMKKGAAAYLRKPFQPDYLIELCAKARRERALLRVQDLFQARTLQLRESEEKFRRIVDSSPVAMFFFRLEGEERLVLTGGNPSADRLLGKSHVGLLGKTFEEAFPPLAATDIPSKYRKVAKGELGPQSIEASYKDERCAGYYELHVFQTAVNHIAVDVVDITERKRAEVEREKLEAQNRQLLKAESLGRMAGAIAHHFNNKLQVVMMNLELAMFDLPPEAGPYNYLNKAVNALHKAAEVSGLMLTYLGQTPRVREVMDLSEACQRSLPLLQAVMPKNVVLDADLPLPGPAIHANADQVQQVLANLITNAWEASGPDQRVIRLTVKTVAAGDIPATRRFPVDYRLSDNDYACLEVADQGCGIAEADLERIFDPFFSTKFTGRGLGLPGILGIVRAHNGVITVESKKDQGSIFRAFLPVSAEGMPRKSDAAVPTPRAAQNGTLLVVEDEPGVRTIVANALERQGYRVLQAQDGVEALELFKQHRAETLCVLCDLTMPRMNGWETLAELRKISPAVRVILCSGFSEAQVMVEKHSEMPQAFLSKPYDLKVLIKTMNQVLASKN